MADESRVDRETHRELAAATIRAVGLNAKEFDTMLAEHRTPPRLKTLLNAIHGTRLQVAALSLENALNVLEQRHRRAALEEQFVSGGSTKTAAEKLAKLHPEYVDGERAIANAEAYRAHLIADAEGMRFLAQWIVAAHYGEEDDTEPPETTPPEG
jgi:hypothetical protein